MSALAPQRGGLDPTGPLTHETRAQTAARTSGGHFSSEDVVSAAGPEWGPAPPTPQGLRSETEELLSSATQIPRGKPSHGDGGSGRSSRPGAVPGADGGRRGRVPATTPAARRRTPAVGVGDVQLA